MRTDPSYDHNLRIRYNVRVVYPAVYSAMPRDHHEIHNERDRSRQTVAPADVLLVRHRQESVFRADVSRSGCHSHGIRHGLQRDRQPLWIAGFSRLRPTGEP